jgi:mono/diheme cytochrome c family protein
VKTGRTVVAAAAALGLSGWSLAAGADAAAGKAKFESTCATCHDVSDFQGEDVKGLSDAIRRIAAGQLQHKSPIKLSDREIADVAAYMSSGGR